MLENNKDLEVKEVNTATSDEKEFKKDAEKAIETKETKTVQTEKNTAIKSLVSDDRVIYSTKTGIIPNFGQINKGYTKVEKNKAKVLVNLYSFIRYASDEEIKTYVN